MLPKLLACIVLADRTRDPEEIRRSGAEFLPVSWSRRFFGTDRARHDDFPVHRGQRNPARTRRRMAGSAPRRRRTSARRSWSANMRCRPTLFGIVMAASAYAVSLPLLLWMTPVIIGLLLCHSDCHAIVTASSDPNSQDCFAHRRRAPRRRCWSVPMNWRDAFDDVAAVSPLRTPA